MGNNDFIYAPTFIGGQGGNNIRLPDQGRTGSNDQVETGNFNNNPAGDSKVPLSAVAGAAAQQADRAMESDRVPGALRGVIRDYFSGIQK